MKIIFLLTHVPNPRMYKRMRFLQRLGEIYVVCARRLNQNVFTVNDEDKISHYIYDLDIPPSFQHINRYKATRKFEKFAFDQLDKLSPDIIYTAGIDMLSIANRYSRYKDIRVIYEVADLRECFIKCLGKSFVQKIIDVVLCCVERRLFKCVSLLLVTSMKFFDVHYVTFFPREKVLELPNMPEIYPFSSYKRKACGDKFVVGFIGCVRYINQLKMLVDVAEKVDVNVFFAGVGSDYDQLELEKYCKGKSWVKIMGKYDYAKDIANLYSMVDCVYSVYDADNPNVRIALPNKLYESVYCELPLIVAKNTYLSELVLRDQVGVAVDHKSKEELKNALLKLKNDTIFYNICVDNCRIHKKDINLGLYMDRLCLSVDSLYENQKK